MYNLVTVIAAVHQHFPQQLTSFITTNGNADLITVSVTQKEITKEEKGGAYRKISSGLSKSSVTLWENFQILTSSRL